MVKVSVLIAIYNAGKDLHRCLESLERQTLKDCEFICIDDCSIDDSVQVATDFMEHDSRFRVVQTSENSGQAVARNVGLQYACGEYITMVDADDWLADDALEKAYYTIKNTPECDCALLQLYTDKSGEWMPYEVPEQNVFTGQEAFRLSLDWTLHGYYLIDRNIHLKYPYDTSCRLYSDDNTTRLHFLHSRKVAMSTGKYYYRQHSESMTHRVSPQRFLFMDAYSSMKEQIVREAKDGNVDDADAVLTHFENLRWLNFLGLMRYYFEYKQEFSPTDKADILNRLAAKLQTFERRRIKLRFWLRFGYIPIKNWILFYTQMKLFVKMYPTYQRALSYVRVS